MITIDLVVNSATTLASAFAGAWVAFRLESKRRKREIAERQQAAANRALYTIYNLWNVLIQFQKEVLEPVRGKPDVWLNMQATLPSNYGLTSFQADELAFLLQSPYANTYSILLLEEQRFWIAIHQIEMRSSIVLNQVFPRLGAASVSVGDTLDETDLERIIGADVVHKLKLITHGVVENVDESIKSLVAAHNTLRDAMKILYPKKKFIRIDFEMSDDDTNTGA